jgi:hypothetical protein
MDNNSFGLKKRGASWLTRQVLAPNDIKELLLESHADLRTTIWETTPQLFVDILTRLVHVIAWGILKSISFSIGNLQSQNFTNAF